MGSLALWLNVSSMNQEPVANGLGRYLGKRMEFIPYRYDEGKEAQFHYPGEVDHNILRKVRETNPDFIVYSGPAGGKCLAATETLASLKEKAKTIGYFLDGGCPEWHPLLEEYKAKNVFDLMVNTDGNPNWPKRPNDVTIWQAMDESYYTERPAKDIRLGFAGGNGAPHRREALAMLKERCGLQVAPRSETWGSYKSHFADFMLRCQMTVNFPETGSEKAFHLKNRVIEAGFAGCCLLEKKNPVTPLYLEPNVDYIEWETLQGLENIIKNISDSEVAFRAHNLALKCRERYTAEKAWQKVFANIL